MVRKGLSIALEPRGLAELLKLLDADQLRLFLALVHLADGEAVISADDRAIAKVLGSKAFKHIGPALEALAGISLARQPLLVIEVIKRKRRIRLTRSPKLITQRGLNVAPTAIAPKPAAKTTVVGADLDEPTAAKRAELKALAPDLPDLADAMFATGSKGLGKPMFWYARLLQLGEQYGSSTLREALAETGLKAAEGELVGKPIDYLEAILRNRRAPARGSKRDNGTKPKTAGKRVAASTDTDDDEF